MSIKTELAKNLLSATLGAWLIATASAGAQPSNPTPPPYNRLNLSSNQAQQIQSLDSEWKNRYEQLQPTLMGEQRQLAKLLAAPKSDPLEITSTQQHINLLREQLSGYATTNYLKKRRLLTPDQQREVEGWLKTKMAERMAGRPD